MTRKRRIVTAALCGVAGILLAGWILLPRGVDAPPITAEKVAPYLRDGDVLCRLGDRLWSLYFRDMSPEDKRFSHLGIVRIRDNRITVINAEGRAGAAFVNEAALEEFLDCARAIGVYRLNGVPGDVISDTALEFKGLPFDWQFDLNSADHVYCTELLYAVLARAAPDITLAVMFQKELGKYIVPLEAVSQSPEFTELCYIKRTGN